MLDVSAAGPLSSTVRLCFTQCMSCKSLFSFDLLGHTTTTAAVTFVVRDNFLTEEKSSRDYTSVPLLRVLTSHPDCFFREHYLRYICAFPTSSTKVLDVSVPGLLCSTVRLYITHHIPFRQTTTKYAA